MFPYLKVVEASSGTELKTRRHNIFLAKRDPLPTASCNIGRDGIYHLRKSRSTLIMNLDEAALYEAMLHPTRTCMGCTHESERFHPVRNSNVRVVMLVESSGASTSSWAPFDSLIWYQGILASLSDSWWIRTRPPISSTDRIEPG